MNTTAPVALRPLVALTALVVAAHLLVLQEAPGSLNFGDGSPARATAITTRTLTPAPASPVSVAARAVPSPTPRPPTKAPPAPPRAAAPPPSGPRNPDLEQKQADPIVERSESATQSIATSTTTAAVTATPVPAAALAAADPALTRPAASAPSPQPAGGVSLSASVAPSMRLLYNVSGQARQFPYSARAELLWRHDGQRYEARLEVSAFLMGARVQTSEGDITPQGLAPRRFADKSRSEQAAHFNRTSQRISFSANTPEAPLLPGAQDRLSLFLQLGALLAADPTRLAPGTSLTLQTVGGRDAEPWLITAEGEERLNLPGGDIAAWKFTRAPRREFDARVDLWLAPSLNYLPVRIRLTQANGDFVDQQMRSNELQDGLR